MVIDFLEGEYTTLVVQFIDTYFAVDNDYILQPLHQHEYCWYSDPAVVSKLVGTPLSILSDTLATILIRPPTLFYMLAGLYKTALKPSENLKCPFYP